MIKGIDVSKHNGVIDWNAVKASGVQFAILRAGYGREVSQKDVKFEENYKAAKVAGVPVGVYWYSYCNSVDDAVREAEACLECIKGKQLEYPVYFDVEERSQFNRGSFFVNEIIKAFCNRIEKAGYFAGLYMSRSPLTEYVSTEVRNRYALWIAEYNNSCKYNGSYGMWQYSSTGRVNGISGNVDMNECYIDYASIIKSKGFNGFKKGNSEPPKQETPKQPEYIKYTVKKNDTLWDIAQKYLKNGSRYKEIMKASGITSETIYPDQKLNIPKL